MEDSLAKKLNLVDWAAITQASPLWAEARARARGGRKVLIPTTVGGFRHILSVESVLAAALTLRGAEVHILICDLQLPGCLRVESADFPTPEIFHKEPQERTLCRDCYRLGEETYKPLGLPIHLLGSWLTAEEREQSRRIATDADLATLPQLKFNGVAVGEHAHAGALRYFARGDLSTEPEGEYVSRRYLEASLLTHFATSRLVEKFGYKVAMFHHGIYVPMGIIGEVCRQHACRVVNWNPAYRKSCFIFSHHNTYHHTLMTEPVETWRNMAWQPVHETQTLGYLHSRRKGSQDWIWFHEKPSEDFASYARTRGIRPDLPCIGLLSNVIWDAQLHYPCNLFPNLVSWVLQTVEYFGRRPDLQLVLRVHPAEIRGTARSRQPLTDEIKRHFPVLPANVFVIGPEENVSTYAAMEYCDSVIIYGTKTGVELTSLGVPVIVAGEAWIRNKGLTIDPATLGEYWSTLDRLPLQARMSDEHMDLARRYAFHFFFRRMIPIQVFQPDPQIKPYVAVLERTDDLLPGRDPGLDIVCKGILEQSPFVFPAETLPMSAGEN
jgi:hypothetical protein